MNRTRHYQCATYQHWSRHAHVFLLPESATGMQEPATNGSRYRLIGYGMWRPGKPHDGTNAEGRRASRASYRSVGTGALIPCRVVRHVFTFAFAHHDTYDRPVHV